MNFDEIRIVVEKDYPGNEMEINKEFIVNKYDYENIHKKYPHIFRKLAWWERRSDDEMPNKLKHRESGEIFEIEGYDLQRPIVNGEIKGILLLDCEPYK